MSPYATNPKAWRTLRLMIVCTCIAILYLSQLIPPTILPTTAAEPLAQREGVAIAASGTIELLTAALAPPLEEQSTYQRYGFYTAPPEPLSTPTSQITVRYDATQPPGSILMLDVRVSADGQRWTSWEVNVANGATVDFPLAARLAQYRARLFGNHLASPTLRSVQVTAVDTPTLAPQVAPQHAVAPTYRIRATRLGLVGYRTANGHIIQPRDHFVALPSWRSLSSRNGNEYQVRITYRGRTAVAPVWDVGPWNTRDDYWSANRERYRDLPVGWPQDHAAYYDGHNGGYAEKGYVRFPTAMDVGDGIWWDELGIHGDQAEVEVTFLWLGADPLAVAPPSTDPTASEYMVDERGPAFHRNDATWYASPTGCGADNSALWTLSVNNTTQRENQAFWQPALPVAGLYDIYAHIPDCPNEYASTQQARYLIQHRSGAEEVVVNQARNKGWVLLGRFPFAANDSGFVHLTDVAGDARRAVWFDNIKWVPVRG